MFKNDYLENQKVQLNNKMLKEEDYSVYLLQAYYRTRKNNCPDLYINNLSFIYSEDNKKDLLKFRKELKNASIEEFVLSETSSALMDIIHALDRVCIKVIGVYTYEYVNEWNDKEIIKGLRMRVE